MTVLQDGKEGLLGEPRLMHLPLKGFVLRPTRTDMRSKCLLLRRKGEFQSMFGMRHMLEAYVRF